MASYPTQQYLWTSNTEWIEDAALYEYCTNAVTHYLARHDNAIPNNGMADASGEDDWENTCTFKLVKIILERQRMVLECNIRALGPMQRYSNPWKCR